MPREIRAVLTVACASFVLLFGYEIIRSSSYAIFKNYFGKENLPFILAALPIFLVPTLILYEKLLSKYGPKRTLFKTSLFSGALIFVTSYFLNQGSSIACIVMFLFREIYTVVIIEQYWSFINSVLSTKQAKRYNGLILCISSLGAVCGGLFLHRFSKDIGTYTLLYATSISCIIAAFVSNYCYSQVPEIKEKKKKKNSKNPFALNLFKEHKILKVILVMIIASQVYCTVINLNFQGHLQEEYPNIDDQTAISGLCFATLNVVSIFFQLVLSPFLLRRLPLTYIHIGIPSVHLLAVIVSFIYPGLWSAVLCLMLFKSLDYSLFRAAKEILYIPLPFDARFRAKEFIDVFGFRFTKSGSSLSLSIATKLGLVLTEFVFSYIGFFAAAGWLYMILVFSKNYIRFTSSSAATQT